jgi:uncharacterized protein (TIGR04552 family)
MVNSPRSFDQPFTVADLEGIRNLLAGGSVIDWRKLMFESEAEAAAFVAAQELDLTDPADVTRIDAVRTAAVKYLRRHFDFPVPSPVANADLVTLLMMASGKGHRQLCACTVLKVMHTIHHLEARELLFQLPVSNEEVFHLVEQKVYRVIGKALAEGAPIVEFIGGRKNKDSLYTKLMSKKDASASQIYDKVRFRVVTRKKDDILPVLLHLGKKLFPFSLVLAGESINTIFHFKSYCVDHPHLRTMIKSFQTGVDDRYTPSDNQFSADSYRVIHFVVDLPIRLPDHVLDLAPASAWPLGQVVFVLCEFQVLDQATEASNERGDASHDRYKERQRAAVKRRLKIGVRPLETPKRPSVPAPKRRA